MGNEADVLHISRHFMKIDKIQTSWEWSEVIWKSNGLNHYGNIGNV